LDHGEEVRGELVVAGSDAAEVRQFREEALDQVALAVEALAESGFHPMGKTACLCPRLP
jgi:hypothetical protein